jgi:hypothetical protein
VFNNSRQDQVFNRYNIVDEKDLKDATQMLEVYIEKQNEQEEIKVSGH